MDIDKTYDDILERYQERRKLRNKINQYKLRKEGRRKGRAERADARWITVGAKEPTNKDPGRKGKHVLIDDEGKVVAGAGGSLTGKKLGGAESTSGEVKVDPKKTTGEVKTGEGKPETESKPKKPRWGDFEHDAETEKKVNEISEKCKSAATKTSWGKMEVPYGVASSFKDTLPHGTVVEIAGKKYIKSGTGWSGGFIRFGDWDGKFDDYAIFEKATDGMKYIGTIDPEKTTPPGVDKEIKFEGNYATEITKKLWEEAKPLLGCTPTKSAKRLDIVTTMDKMPKGSTIELEDGTVYKKFQNEWKKKYPESDTFKKAYGVSSDFNSALMNGKVKAITAQNATAGKGGEGSYGISLDNPFAAKYGDKYKPMHKIISDNKGTESTLWKHFENRMVVEVKGKMTCYVSGTWRIMLGGGLKGSKGYHPYESVFHEGGHLIDDRLAEAYTGHAKGYKAIGFGLGITREHLSEVYEEGKLRKTMEGEWKEAKEKLIADYQEKVKSKIEKGVDPKTLYYTGAISKDDYDTLTWYQEHSSEVDKGITDKIKPKEAGANVMLNLSSGKEWSVYGDVLDMFCMASHGKFGSGHAKSYAAGNEHTSTEFFAEAYSAKMCNPESLELIKRYFPKSYDVFEEILEWAAKNYTKV